MPTERLNLRDDAARVPKLTIGADGFSLPLELAGETISVVAKKKAGKTYTGAVLTEELIGAGVPVVVVDPTSSWWGLRSSADGKGPGIPIVIFGGEHKDVALEPTMGAALADLHVDERLSLVMDIAEFTVGEQHRFFLEFATRLYHRKAMKRELMHLMIDEADEFAPQERGVGGDVLKMLGATERLVRRGRSRGIGVSLITQRSAVLNKNVLSQSDTLILLQTTAPQDIDAIDAWIKRNASADERERVLSSLARLQVGQAWIWNPGLGVLVQKQIRRRRTFDSSATPKAGEAAAAPAVTAEVDLDVLRSRFAASIERAKADDPKALHATIADLRKQLAAKPTVDPEHLVALKQRIVELERRPPERVEVPVLSNADRATLREDALAAREAATSVVDTAERVLVAIARVEAPVALVAALPVPARSVEAPSRVVRNSEASPPTAPLGKALLGKGELATLKVMAQYPSGVTREQLSAKRSVAASQRASHGTFRGTKFPYRAKRSVAASGRHERGRDVRPHVSIPSEAARALRCAARAGAPFSH